MRVASCGHPCPPHVGRQRRQCEDCRPGQVWNYYVGKERQALCGHLAPYSPGPPRKTCPDCTEARPRKQPRSTERQVCKWCIEGFLASRPAKFCSRACAVQYQQRHKTVACTEGGCSRPYTARGLCSTHYNQKHQPNRHAKVLVTCDYCGVDALKPKTGKYAHRFCSEVCRDLWRLANPYLILRGSCPVPDTHPSRSTRVPEDHPSRWPAVFPATRIYVVDCAWCERTFVHNQPAVRFCGARCSRSYHKARRGRRFVVSTTRRRRLYERDGWQCQLCLDPVDPDLPVSDPWSATLDHIEPQSHALIPDHSDSNLRLAHRWCNSVRQDGTGPCLLPSAA